jgi:formylglycine-generating enzyme required for sulfatase activity
MGSPLDEPDRRPDETPVNVTISRGFWAGKYEVTQGQWRRFAGEFPQPPTAGDGPNLPVCWVSFIEAETFARKLTERAHAAGELPALWEFRLPTEAQWEYACRAGTVTAFAFGNTIGSKQANILEGPALKHMTEVGKYPPNSWGLHDTHGNTFEWCRDWYHASLPGGVDPDLSTVQGVPNRDGTYSRVRRGGAYNDEPKFCRSAFRLRYEPERRSDHIGFRVVAVQA